MLTSGYLSSLYSVPSMILRCHSPSASSFSAATAFIRHGVTRSFGPPISYVRSNPSGRYGRPRVELVDPTIRASTGEGVPLPGIGVSVAVSSRVCL